MHLNDFGNIVWSCWNDLPNHYTNLELDTFIVMPNHIHGIIVITKPINSAVGEGLKPSPTHKQHGLPEIIRGLKTFSARYINKKRNTKGIPVWQRSFHDHIVRDEYDLTRLRKYTVYNPSLWAKDKYYSDS